MSISEERLVQILEKHKQEIVQSFTQQIDDLKKELKDTQSTLNITHQIATNNENDVILLKSEINTLKKSQEDLRNQLDDQMNRGMRKTLIFRGVKEEPNENWAATEKILVNTLINNTDITPQIAERLIERAHRGKKSTSNNTNNNINTPTPIFAQFYDWKDAQNILDQFKRINITNKNKKIFVDQLYSPTLTARRNLALLERKSLKENKIIASGYVAFPAILMVKKTGETKFTKHHSF